MVYVAFIMYFAIFQNLLTLRGTLRQDLLRRPFTANRAGAFQHLKRDVRVFRVMEVGVRRSVSGFGYFIFILLGQRVEFKHQIIKA